MPLLAEYRWFRGLWTASASFSTATSGDGRSGLPKPRSMTSLPARRAASFSASMCAKTYGGRPLIRRNSIARGYPAAVARRPAPARRRRRSGAAHVARPPRPPPRATPARRTPPTWRRPRPAPPAAARSGAASPATGPAQSPRTRPASPATRRRAGPPTGSAPRPSSTASSVVAGDPPPTHTGTPARAGAAGARGAAPAGARRAGEGDPVGQVLGRALAVAGPEPGDQAARRHPVERQRARPPGPRRARARRAPPGARSRPGPVAAATAPSTGKADRAGRSRRAHGPEVVEDEHAVEAELLGPARRVEGGGVVAERRQRHPDPHGTPRTPSALRPRRRGSGRRRAATSAAPMAPARSPSRAGTILTSGR